MLLQFHTILLVTGSYGSYIYTCARLSLVEKSILVTELAMPGVPSLKIKIVFDTIIVVSICQYNCINIFNVNIK